jgi:hypothetical protein
MFPEKIKDILSENLRPVSKAEYYAEIESARKNGYNIPDIDFDSLLVTQVQAANAMGALNISRNSAFYHLMHRYRDFPSGKGEELYNLSLILEENTFDSRYLRFTSIEGEGSYFYDIETDAVYDVNWGEEELMVLGEKQPWFTSFYDFIEWYYAE